MLLAVMGMSWVVFRMYADLRRPHRVWREKELRGMNGSRKVFVPQMLFRARRDDNPAVVDYNVHMCLRLGRIL